MSYASMFDTRGLGSREQAAAARRAFRERAVEALDRELEARLAGDPVGADLAGFAGVGGEPLGDDGLASLLRVPVAEVQAARERVRIAAMSVASEHLDFHTRRDPTRRWLLRVERGVR
jgi:hypothetical protein